MPVNPIIKAILYHPRKLSRITAAKVANSDRFDANADEKWKAWSSSVGILAKDFHDRVNTLGQALGQQGINANAVKFFLYRHGRRHGKAQTRSFMLKPLVSAEFDLDFHAVGNVAHQVRNRYQTLKRDEPVMEYLAQVNQTVKETTPSEDKKLGLYIFCGYLHRLADDGETSAMPPGNLEEFEELADRSWYNYIVFNNLFFERASIYHTVMLNQGVSERQLNSLMFHLGLCLAEQRYCSYQVRPETSSSIGHLEESKLREQARILKESGPPILRILPPTWASKGTLLVAGLDQILDAHETALKDKGIDKGEWPGRAAISGFQVGRTILKKMRD